MSMTKTVNELAKDITYMIKEGLVIQDIRKMNSTARAWTMQEFLDSLC